MQIDDNGFKFLEHDDDYYEAVRAIYDDVLLLYEILKKTIDKETIRGDTMRKCPCQGCADRVADPNCHPGCKQYEDWRIENAAIQDDLKDHNALGVSDYALRIHWDRIKRKNRR